MGSLVRLGTQECYEQRVVGADCELLALTGVTG